MTDKSKEAISNFVNGEIRGVNQMQLLETEIQTGSGLQGVKLLNEEHILSVNYTNHICVKL